jgi:putative spermidine/putrescine transport system ATP-binding protein
MTDQNDTIVDFKNIQKTYDGETLVVKDFNLEVKRGEFVTLLGPSGSGKTTCLMMVAGFETPTHGDIMLNDVPITHVPPHKRGIGMVFQNYTLFPHMTVAENLAFPLEVRKIDRSAISEKVQRALDMVRLGEFGTRRPAQLSGGQQQRVALARALVFEPDLVLMDEPLGALDKNLREEMQLEIKHIHEQLGLSVIFVTHDQSEALTMSVAYFIGENNRLNGTVKEMKDGHCMVQLDDDAGIVEALTVNVSDTGDRTTLSLRPERAIVNPPEGEYPNLFEATVQEVIYMGDHLRTRVELCGHDDFVIKIPNNQDHDSLKRGQTVRVGWRADDCRALDA